MLSREWCTHVVGNRQIQGIWPQINWFGVRCRYGKWCMYGIYANIWDILMVNVTIYSIHGSYGIWKVIRILDGTKINIFHPKLFRSFGDSPRYIDRSSIIWWLFMRNRFPQNNKKDTFSMLCCLNSWCCFLKSAKRMLTGTFRGNYFKPMISYYFKWTCAILCNRWQFRPMGDDQE